MIPIQKLMQAAGFSPCEELQRLIENGMDIGLKDEYGRSALYKAYLMKRTDNAEILHNAGLYFESAEEKLICGVFIESDKMLEEAVNEGADLNHPDSLNYTPLQTAAEDGLVKSIRKLVDLGADMEKRERFGMTALHIAAWSGQPESLRALVSAGAGINNRDEFGETPLLSICSLEPKWEFGINLLSEERLECLKILLESEAETDILNNNGKTALDLADENTYITAANLLREYGALESRYL